VIKLRYEINTRDRVIVEELEEPADWAAMTNPEREAYCIAALTDGLSNYVGTSFEYEGQDS
jgi:hypothetical protein